MGLSRRQFTKEFKLAAVRRLELRVSIAEAARALEVSANVLHRWRRELRAMIFYDESKFVTSRVLGTIANHSCNSALLQAIPVIMFRLATSGGLDVLIQAENVRWVRIPCFVTWQVRSPNTAN